MATLSDLSLAAFVEAVGEDRPAPGCGAAAALALALAAACARKAFTISARRQDDTPALAAAAERCRALAQAALAGAERDATHFRALLKAEPGDEAPAEALERDGERLLGLAAELRSLLALHGPAVEAELAADAQAALALVEAFERIERRNLAEVRGR